MKPNDFDTNISVKHSKTFSTRMRILLFLALLMTGLISIVGIIQIVLCLKEHIWQSTDVLPFAWNTLFFLCIFCCFVSLLKIALSDQPFYKSLVLCVQMIGCCTWHLPFCFRVFQVIILLELRFLDMEVLF